MISKKQILINKITYRSKYRGTKEMDIFLSSFVNSIINTLTLHDLKVLDSIVNLNDEDILKISIDKKVQEKYKNNKIVELIRNFKHKK
tara:strand:+ start:847 stop:1110 length:264 start_codon:yes stop_codon:yes gene_type:complete